MFPTVRMVRLGMMGSKEPVNRFRLSETTSTRMVSCNSMPLLIQQDRNSWWAVCGSSSQEGREAQFTQGLRDDKSIQWCVKLTQPRLFLLF